MTNNTKYHHQPPGLFALYGKAALPGKSQKSSSAPLPDVTAELIGVRTGGKKLNHYRSVCGFAQRTSVPVTWPHVLAFPLHLKVLTDDKFPLPLLGLVHLRNTITQHRPIGEGETLDLKVSLGEKVQTARGLEFDIITEARSAGVLVWEENSTTLYRQPDKSSVKSSGKKPPELKSLPHTHDISVGESTGRQYASASGDRNPIHLYPVTAKLFGFPRAIVHGMWSKARVLGWLEQQSDWRDEAFTVTCEFKKPLFLPSGAQIHWETGKKSWEFQLRNASGDAPHLVGQVDWLK